MTTIADYQTALSRSDEALNKANSVISNLEIENRILKEKVRLLQYRHFGKSSEKIIDKSQIPLLDTPIVEAPEVESESEEELIEVKAHAKKKPGRKPIPEALPREEVLLDLPKDQKKCATHGVDLEKIGEE